MTVKSENAIFVFPHVSGVRIYTVILLLMFHTALSSGLLPDEQALLSKLFNEQQYDNSVRPVFNSSKNVEVMIGFTLVQIMDMVSISIYDKCRASHSFFLKG